MSRASAAYRRHAALWLVATVGALVGAVGLGAQAPPMFEEVPVIRGAVRDDQAEASLRADSGQGLRDVKVFHTPGSIERLFKFYLGVLGGRPGGHPDSLAVPPGGWSPVTYFIEYHSFEDECVEPASSVPAVASAEECDEWRRGKDKRRALENARIAYDGGRWIEAASITWFRPGPSGKTERIRLEIRDEGLSDNWRHDKTRARILIERVIPPQPAR